ncbi:hypothetical protein DB32_000684 [Sandaracinus amylolyticus]|uniref:Uncharacterized protein n=2 Tax=Sandaracinus amylolyticus TaxID=927083 RepID=A0A0F6YH20_9BACT|nr:hypothetical protein DB32_000684 [Sandaracinus amylolyticus]
MLARGSVRYARAMPDTREEEVRYDAEAAERGFRDTTALRAAVRDPSAPRGLDLQQAALFGLRIARQLAEPAVKARFDRLPDDLLSPSARNTIGPAAWALWYAVARRASATAGESSARLSEATLQRASAIKARMMKVAEYVLDGDARAATELASIRAGAGHADLAEDLTRLAALYREHAARLAEGGVHYRRTDARSARDAAAAILAELNDDEPSEARIAREDAFRAFRVLEQTYEPVRLFGRALFAHDGEERFPTIYSIRPARGSRTSEEGEGEEEGEQDEDK